MVAVNVQREVVRSELALRIAAMEARTGTASSHCLASELEEVRRIAQAHDLGPAVTVIHALDSALARGERGAIVRNWLAILSDALGSGACDREADALFAAACAVRLAS